MAMVRQRRNIQGKDSAGEEHAPASSSGNTSEASTGKPHLHEQKAAEPAMNSETSPVRHWRWIAALTILAAFVRFYRIDHPAGVVFDEHHFGRFTNQYTKGTYFFDIHPPLGKLTLLLVSKLAGYDPEPCDYSQIHNEYPAECNFLPLRITAATFGVATVPVLYAVVRTVGGSYIAASLSCLLFALDGLNTIESRLLLVDSQLIFYAALCMLAGLQFYQRWEKHVRGARMSWLEMQVWLVLLGAACCAAVSIKWTGLAVPAMIALELTFAMWFISKPLPLWALLEIGAVVVGLYALQWKIHFDLLPLAGDGDAFMRLEFQRSLIGNEHYDANAPKQSFWVSMWQLNAEMLAANARIDVPHHWSSLWTQWPVNQRGVLYWSKPSKVVPGTQETVYLLANPAVAWAALLGVCTTAMLLVFYARFRTDDTLGWQAGTRRGFVTLGYFLAQYALNLLPYVAVNRAAFVYHYMPALLQAEILLPMLLDRGLDARELKFAAALIVALVVAAFVYFAPWVYALPLTTAQHDARRWLKTWN